MSNSESHAEVNAIVSRYAVRDAREDAQRYSWLRPDVHLASMESERLMLKLFAEAGLTDLSRVSLLEVGCGGGGNLLRFLRWGFDPANLVGNELLPASLERARRHLPQELALIGGDASELDCEPFDIVYQSTVFSSILDQGFQHKLAQRMWDMTRPGGAILWYDFCYDNPRNPDVRGVSMRRIRELFPMSSPVMRRVTLAPPISRAATRLSPRLYPVLNVFSFLRTHALCWIPKPAASDVHSAQ
ncbi:Methyltransferase domain-containing protein [Noviherbaspirillum humi]|uniref:Methyltransferase domain-containing protein n=1 Tax=Noviherbaspirillum humi TaxID=1688639 RepID=A0A239GA75_9BURK|nr:class I SAM-dependent methyltransferase [Noviherbaspirillum humi]SNS65612.1 Methyltransferase domain-containing protein [Noviherbaspirillum humi]